MVCHQTVEEVNIILANGAQVEEFVDGGVFETQLSQASCLLDFVALCARRSEAVGAEVFADVGRVGGIVVGVTVDDITISAIASKHHQHNALGGGLQNPHTRE